MKKKILFVVSTLYGLLFINAGLNKIFNYMPLPDVLPQKMALLMKSLTEIEWILPLIAIVEIIGGILFIISKTRALAAIIISPIVIGIVLTNAVTEPSGLPLGIVLLIINIWILYENREKYLRIIK